MSKVNEKAKNWDLGLDGVDNLDDCQLESVADVSRHSGGLAKSVVDIADDDFLNEDNVKAKQDMEERKALFEKSEEDKKAKRRIVEANNKYFARKFRDKMLRLVSWCGRDSVKMGKVKTTKQKINAVGLAKKRLSAG